jgi:hypothetical protein
MKIEKETDIIDHNTLIDSLSKERSFYTESLREANTEKCECCKRIVHKVGYSGLKGICKECINSKEFEKFSIEKGKEFVK